MLRRENHARLAILFVIALSIAVGSCSSSVRKGAPADQEVLTAPYGDDVLVGEEVVVGDDQRDDFGKPLPGPEGKAGELLVAVGYIGMIVGGIILPLLAL